MTFKRPIPAPCVAPSRAQLVSEALTGAEARRVSHAFLSALECFDATGDVTSLVRNLQASAVLAEDLANGST